MLLARTNSTFDTQRRADSKSPADMVEFAIDRYFLERPNENREKPFDSEMLSGISARELLSLYFSLKDANLCLSYFGLSGAFPDTVSAASFVNSWPVNSAPATR